MTIETRYNVGEMVWYMHENRVRQSVITELRITVSIRRTEDGILAGQVYLLEYQVDVGVLTEKYLFPTKEALLASL